MSGWSHNNHPHSQEPIVPRLHSNSRCAYNDTYSAGLSRHKHYNTTTHRDQHAPLPPSHLPPLQRVSRNGPERSHLEPNNSSHCRLRIVVIRHHEAKVVENEKLLLLALLPNNIRCQDRTLSASARTTFSKPPNPTHVQTKTHNTTYHVERSLEAHGESLVIRLDPVALPDHRYRQIIQDPVPNQCQPYHQSAHQYHTPPTFRFATVCRSYSCDTSNHNTRLPHATRQPPHQTHTHMFTR